MSYDNHLTSLTCKTREVDRKKPCNVHLIKVLCPLSLDGPANICIPNIKSFCHPVNYLTSL